MTEPNLTEPSLTEPSLTEPSLTESSLASDSLASVSSVAQQCSLGTYGRREPFGTAQDRLVEGYAREWMVRRAHRKRSG